MSDSPAALLTLSGVSKYFGGVQALRDVDVTFEAGKVHALVGENGAGKSTLGKLILGVHRPNAGQMTLDGHEVTVANPAEALRMGLVGIAQELSLMPRATVLDNIALGREVTRHGLVDKVATRRFVTDLMDRFDMQLDPSVRVGDLGMAERQKVEILRALGRDARLIIFDEPTARLASYQAKQLLKLIRALAASGKAVIYVSHFLEEILEVSDTITILRNGQKVRTGPASAETRETLVAGVTGQDYQHQFPPRQVPQGGAPVLKVRGLTVKGQFEGVDLDLRPGEILGLAGLVGAGRSEVVHAIYGALPVDAGSVEFDGKVVTQGNIRSHIDAGMAMIPESRRDQGLFLGRPILENTSLPYLKRFAGWLGLAKAAEQKAVTGVCAETSVKYGSLHDHVEKLSGGNQQKILFARAALGRPRLLIADEPTRGVDVGAKRAIYDMIVRLAAQGEAILLVSSEIEEIMGLSHRVVVLSRGRVAAHLSGDGLTEMAVMQAAFSGV
jgi:ABC-type sugar transport system ATPase subunit